MQSALVRKQAARPALSRTAPKRAMVVPRAVLDPAIVISGSTAFFLAMGRFVFLGYQRSESNYAASMPPKATGNSYFNNLSKQSINFSATNDPSGFNAVDVLAWGALGHATAFGILGVSSFIN